MKHFVLQVFCKLFCLLLSFSLYPINSLDAQKLSISTSSSEVGLGERFQIEIAAENIDSDKLQEPDLNPFRILSGPGSSYSMQWINGVKTTRRSWTYTLQAPMSAGTFAIRPFVLKSGKNKIVSNTIEIRVVAAKRNDDAGKIRQNGISLELLSDKSEAFVGESVRIEATIYTSTDIASLEIGQYPSFSDCHVEEMRNPAEPPERVTIKGRNYLKKTVYRITIFPQRSGLIEISPMELIAFLQADADDQDPFAIFRRAYELIQILSNPLKIKVLDLPLPVPVDFCGAVGTFDFSLKLSKTSPISGEAFDMRIRARGEGDVKRIQFPRQPLSEPFSVFEKRIDTSGYFEQNAFLFALHSANYTLICNESGLHEILIPIVWFDTKNKAYVRTELKESLSADPPRQGTQHAGSPLQSTERVMEQSKPSINSSGRVSIFRVSMIVASIALLSGLLVFGINRFRNQTVKSRVPSVSPLLTDIYLGPNMSAEDLALHIKRNIYLRLGVLLHVDSSKIKMLDIESAASEGKLRRDTAEQIIELIKICDVILYYPVKPALSADELWRKWQGMQF